MDPKPPPKPKGRKPNPTRAAIREVQNMVSLTAATNRPASVSRAERADALADDLIDGITNGEYVLTTAFDAARVAKLMVEIARLDRGQATQITAASAPATPQARLERFRELTGQVIETTETQRKGLTA